MKILNNLVYRYCSDSELTDLYDTIEHIKAELNNSTVNAYLETHNRFTADNTRSAEFTGITKASMHISEVLKQLEQCQAELITVMGYRFAADVTSNSREASDGRD